MGFNSINQIVTVTIMNIRNIPQRLGASSVAVFGVACVVGVFIGVLSMASGFQKTMVGAGSEDTVVVLRSGSMAELNSGLDHEQIQLIMDAPGVLRHDNKPVASAELYVIVDIIKRSTGTAVNVPLRGVQTGAFTVRDNINIVEGRRFEEGRNELIVGRAAQRQFAGLDMGSTLKFGQSEWRVVGVFEAGGSVSESELWSDVRVLQPAYRRSNTFQSVRVKLESPQAYAQFKEALASNPRLDVSIQYEREYYAAQSEGLSRFIKIVGYPLAFLMALGAVFGAINTMYASVSARAREIATLRALGFGAFPVAVSTLLESLLLSLLGSLIGAIAVYALFNGYSVSTMNGPNFSQVVFDFAVTPGLLVEGFNAAVWIGLLGGVFPAIRAARMPVVMALREL